MMKKTPFHFYLLLICALALSLNGILHPCLHHHDSHTGNGTVIRVLPGHTLNQPDDSFCPLCSGILTGLEWSGTVIPQQPAAAIRFSAFPDSIPPSAHIHLPPARAPPILS